MCQNSHGQWELAGVFSFIAKGCDVPEFPPVFTNVTGILPWINEKGLGKAVRYYVRLSITM